MTNIPTNTGTADDHHNIWPLWYLLGGLAIGLGWLWGNVVQIQTSEAWILQLKTGIDLAPHFAILLQVADFFNVSAGVIPSRFRCVLAQWLGQCSTLLKRYQGRYRLPLTPLEKRAQRIGAPLKRKKWSFLSPLGKPSFQL